MKSETCEQNVIFLLAVLLKVILSSRGWWRGALSCSEVVGAYSKALMYISGLHWLYIFIEHFLV